MVLLNTRNICFGWEIKNNNFPLHTLIWGLDIYNFYCTLKNRKKEKQDVDNMQQQNIRAMFTDQSSFQAKLTKEQVMGPLWNQYL